MYVGLPLHENQIKMSFHRKKSVLSLCLLNSTIYRKVIGFIFQNPDRRVTLLVAISLTLRCFSDETVMAQQTPRTSGRIRSPSVTRLIFKIQRIYLYTAQSVSGAISTPLVNPDPIGMYPPSATGHQSVQPLLDGVNVGKGRRQNGYVP